MAEMYGYPDTNMLLIHCLVSLSSQVSSESSDSEEDLAETLLRKHSVQVSSEFAVQSIVRDLMTLI